MSACGFITIPDWMQELDLDIYETIILAVIFGFSQDGDSRFSGSQNYLAKKAKCSRRKVITCLENLMEKNLILKFDVNIKGSHLCEYTINPDAFSAQVVNVVHRGCECGAHNNIEDNIYNTLSNTRTKKFEKPSIEEIANYCNEKSYNIDPEQFFSFYESKGWVVGKSPMKDWKAAVKTWVKRQENTPAAPSAPRSESALAKNLKIADKLFGTHDYEKVYGKH